MRAFVKDCEDLASGTPFAGNCGQRLVVNGGWFLHPVDPGMRQSKLAQKRPGALALGPSRKKLPDFGKSFPFRSQVERAAMPPPLAGEGRTTHTTQRSKTRQCPRE